jgi:hypothetical protein
MEKSVEHLWINTAQVSKPTGRRVIRRTWKRILRPVQALSVPDGGKKEPIGDTGGSAKLLLILLCAT